MKRNILLLINGFGIEQSGSYNIYNPELMPNLDKLSKERLFSSIPCQHLDYKSGYRDFSMGISRPLSYSVVENSINAFENDKNEVFQSLINFQKSLNSKIHIICFYEDEKTIEHLIIHINKILENSSAEIVIHLILCQKSLNDYKHMPFIMNKINYDNGSRVKLSVVIGEKNFNKDTGLKDFVKSLLIGYGEKWNNVSKKINVLSNSGTIPNNTRLFIVNNINIEENDIVYIFNYKKINISSLINEISIQKYKSIDINKLKFFSLFPLDLNIPFMYNYAVSSISSAKALGIINAKCLILDKRENCSDINYYMTGLKNNIESFLNYLPIDNDIIYNKDRLINIFTKYNHEFIIINYEIKTTQSIEELKQRLSKIDEIIGALADYAQKQNNALIISSFYGMESELLNDKHELCKINLSKRVPLIIVDNDISKRNNIILEGSLFDLSNTIYKNINPIFKEKGIIRKKSNLLSVFYKK